MSTISGVLASLFSPVSMEPSNASNSTNTSSGSNNSSSNSASSSSTGSASSSFLGTSAYSSTLQASVARATQIAELPIQLLTNQQTALSGEWSALNNIDGLVSTLQSAVQGIQSAMAGSSFDSSVIDSSGKTSTAAQVTLDDNAQEGVYPVTINSIGSYASGVTSGTWAPANRSSTFNLVVGGQAHTITTTDNTATGIASAINQQYGNLVQASVMNFSSTDTRIALQSTSLGQQTIDLQTSSGTSLFQQNVNGSQAEYTVMNGQPVFTNSRSAEISPGVTINMVAPTTSPINISITRSDSALSSALSSFAAAYNAVEDAVTAQHGQNAGPLQGNTILSTVSHVLSQISLFSTGNGPVNSIYNLGLELNANGNMNGHLTFNPFKLAAADIGGSSNVDAFLGNSGSTGFLQNAINLLNNLEAPATGLVKGMESNLQTQLTNIGTTISTKQDAVTRMQTSLTAQMAKADALIAATEQQFNYLNSVYQAQQMETLQYTQL